MSIKLQVINKLTGASLGLYDLPDHDDRMPQMDLVNRFFTQGFVAGLYVTGALLPGVDVEGLVAGRAIEDLDFETVEVSNETPEDLDFEAPAGAQTVGEVKAWASISVTHPDGSVSE